MMNPAGLVENIQDLTDLELAVLVSLLAGQHCLVETESEAVESAAQELQLVSNLSSTWIIAEDKPR